MTIRGASQAGRHYRALTGGLGRSQGFTLLEIIVVILLIAAVTGLAVGVLGIGGNGRDLRGTARSLQTELRFTRMQAMATGTSQTFSLDLDSRQWDAAGKHHGEIPKSLQVKFDAVRVEQPDVRSAAIRFFPDGSSTGGRISLRIHGNGMRVDVRWLTGEVSQTSLVESAP